MKARIAWIAVTTAVVVAAVAAAATAGNGNDGRKMAALRHQVATLKAQNRRLGQYTPAGIARQLAATKAALSRYQSVDQAKADGYVMTGACAFSQAGPGEESSHAGGMGVHFTSQAALADGKLIPTRPEVLVYQPTADGGFQLVAAEYFKPDADQDVKTDGDRPSLFGRAFDGPMLGHSPDMPIHYDLHVWLWKPNPSGMFAPWNRDVSCS